MSKFAVIETGGKQYKVIVGQKLKIEKLEIEKGGNVSFDKVFLVAEGDNVEIGTPTVKGAKVEGTVIRQSRDKKKIVFKYHAKARYRKKKGHRQPYTEIEISKI